MIRNRQLTLVSVQKVNDLMTHGERLKIKKKKTSELDFGLEANPKTKRKFKGCQGQGP